MYDLKIAVQLVKNGHGVEANHPDDSAQILHVKFLASGDGDELHLCKIVHWSLDLHVQIPYASCHLS